MFAHKLRSLLCGLFAGFLFPLVVCAQSTEPGSQIDEKSREVIERCIEAMGGEMELASIDSMTVRALLQIENSIPRVKAFMRVSGVNSVSEIGQKITTGSNGIHMWYQTPGQPPVLMTEVQSSGIQNEAYPFPATVIGWVSFSGNVRFIGDEEFQNAIISHLEFESDNGSVIQRYFEKESGLLVGQSFDNKPGTIEMFEYSEVENLTLATKQHLTMPNETKQSTEFVYELNSEFDESIFEFPAEIKEQIARLERDAATDK